jgi:hypothetical protein
MTSRYFASCLAAACVLVTAAAHANTKKTLRFWNLAATTITELYVAAPGTGKWSPNLCLDDQDHSVDPDERLSLGGTESGTYDVRVVDEDKRKCLFSSVALRAQGPYAFSVSEDEKMPWMVILRRRRKVFFSEEKKQKTFVSLSRFSPAAHRV